MICAQRSTVPNGHELPTGIADSIARRLDILYDRLWESAYITRQHVLGLPVTYHTRFDVGFLIENVLRERREIAGLRRELRELTAVLQTREGRPGSTGDDR
jgi:hypothetical protein